MNFFIIANNPKYESNDVDKFYSHKDKVVRLGNIWKAKNCKTLLKGKCDIHILRTSPNHFIGCCKPRYKPKSKPYGVIGNNLDLWISENNLNKNDYDPLIDLKDNIVSNKKVSSGFAAAFYYSTQFPKSNIYLVGFKFSGYVGHDWKKEKQWCLEQENIKII